MNDMLIVDENENYEDYVSEEQDDSNIESEDTTPLESYDLVSSPNDFNSVTIVNYMESGRIKVPFFQRNYVWDIYKASRLIESLIFGLPIPQIYLYTESNNVLKVIDGQQRLLSIYFFMKKKFPIKEKLTEIREIISSSNTIPDKVFDNKQYFIDFRLKFKKSTPSILQGYNYSTLDELGGNYREEFDLRTLRSIIIKQISPQGDRAMFEVFNRLNTGGVNLRPQEIRMSLYDSFFYRMLLELNKDQTWRKLLRSNKLSQYMQDVEVILRGFALLLWRNNYKPSLANFLNEFSDYAKSFTEDFVENLRSLFVKFVNTAQPFSETFSINNKFNIALFEAVFVAACKDGIQNQTVVDFSENQLKNVLSDKDFVNALHEGTTKANNMKLRLDIAEKYIC